MCERCDKAREDMWAEIRDLLNYNRRIKGPLSEQVEESIASAIEAGMSEENSIHASELLRAEMIAVRCAFIARAIPDQQFHRLPPSIVLGLWAGTTMEAEQTIVLDKLLGNLSNLFARENDEEA